MPPSVSIDWLQVTHHWNTGFMQPFRNLPDLHSLAHHLSNEFGPWVEERATNGYSRVVSQATCAGIRVMASHPNSPMGSAVSWSGSALTDRDALTLLRRATFNGGQCSRIDIALDVHESLNMPELYRQHARGDCKTQAKSRQIITSDSGQTLYIGSRTSEKFLRIYDKAAEQGVDGPWTRIELECKGDFAKTIAQHLSSVGLMDIPAIIRGFADWPMSSAWVDATNSPTLSQGLPKIEKQRDVEKWLLTLVAPALVKQLKASPDFVRRWNARMWEGLGGVGEAVEPDIFDGKADF